MEIAVVLCSILLVAASPGIAADKTTQKISANTITTASEDDYVLGVYGNANEDDTIDMRDLTYVKLIFFGKKPETELADAKYDGKINPLDFIQIKLIIVGKEKELTFIDNAERIVTVKKPIERIVMLSTDSAEVVRTLGAKDKIVGVSTYLAKDKIFFPDIAKLPTVGSSFHPDCEAVLSLKPDIVFAYTSALKYFADTLETAGISVAGFSGCKLLTRDVQLRTWGYILGKTDGAEELIDFYHGCTDPIAESVKGIPEEKKPKVYIECYNDYRARNKRSGAHPMCEMAGGINIGADLDPFGEGTTFEVDPEWVIEQNPDVIVKVVSGSKVSSGYDEDDPAEMEAVRNTIMSRTGFENIAAVKNGRVYLICPDICERSSNSIGVAYFAKWFHPTIFEDLDPQAIHQEYIDEFCGIDYDVTEHGVFVYPEPS